MVKTLIAEAANALLPVLVTAVSAGVAWLGKTLNAWLSAKVKNERLNHVLQRVGSVVGTVVLELQQTEVAALKSALDESSPDGRKITKEEGELLLELALKKVKTYLGKNGLKTLSYVMGISDAKTLDSFLVSKIEASVFSVKSSSFTKMAAPLKVLTATSSKEN